MKTYITLSALNTYENTFGLREFKKSDINQTDALLGFEHLKQNLFFKIKRNTFSDNTLTILFHNMRSISKCLQNKK